MKTIDSRVDALEKALQINKSQYCECRISAQFYLIRCIEDNSDMEADRAKPQICEKCNREIDPKMPNLIVSISGWEHIHRADLPAQNE